jgi:hypothetical protein
VSAAALLALSPAHAANDDNTGCGLGTEVFKGKTGKVYEILAVTTNGTSGNQTFAITTGTSGCSDNGVIGASDQVKAFAGANIDKLARDAARGEGESLESLAALIGIQEQDRPAFYRLSQHKFATIFPSEKVKAGDVIKTWYGVMAQDKALSHYVMA